MIDFRSELTFKTSRSSGAGGQNVNKVETAVTVLWNYKNSRYFDDSQKQLIAGKLKNRSNTDGVLQYSASEARTQLQNRKIAVQKILEAVNIAFIVPKIRHKTKPSRAKIEQRLQTKKKLSEKKQERRFKW